MRAVWCQYFVDTLVEDVDEDEADKEDDEDSKEKEVLAEDALVEVKVGDETNQVSVKELTRLYGQEKSLTQKSSTWFTSCVWIS